MEQEQVGQGRSAEFRVELVNRAPTYAELTISRDLVDGSQVVTDRVDAPLAGLPTDDYPALWEAITVVADRLLSALGWVHESGWMRHAAETPWEDGGTCGEAWLSCAALPAGAPEPAAAAAPAQRTSGAPGGV